MVKKTGTFQILAVACASAVLVSGCSGEATSVSQANESQLTSANTPRLPNRYESLDGCQKQDLLWERIEATRYNTLPTWKAFDLVRFTFLNMSLTMDRVNDEMPEGRKRLIHTYGSVATVTFEPAPNPEHSYTGLWRSGSACGLLRASLAADPSALGVVPGLGLKFFVDGKPSENMIAMYSLDGQGKNSNFFANVFSNIVSEPSNPALKLLKAVFERASKHPTKLGIAHMGEVDDKGNTVANPRSPEQIFLSPTQAAQLPEEPGREVRLDLATLPEGTVLYNVWGLTKEGGSRREFLGTIKTTSRFVASQYGDENLFFRHRRFNNE